MHVSEDGHARRGSYSLKQSSQGFCQRHSGHGSHLNSSGSSQQSMVSRSCYSYEDSGHMMRHCPRLGQRGPQFISQVPDIAAVPPAKGWGRSQTGRDGQSIGRGDNRAIVLSDGGSGVAQFSSGVAVVEASVMLFLEDPR